LDLGNVEREGAYVSNAVSPKLVRNRPIPKPDYPELVEGLPFFATLAEEKDSPSTSSG